MKNIEDINKAAIKKIVAKQENYRIFSRRYN